MCFGIEKNTEKASAILGNAGMISCASAGFLCESEVGAAATHGLWSWSLEYKVNLADPKFVRQV